MAGKRVARSKLSEVGAWGWLFALGLFLGALFFGVSAVAAHPDAVKWHEVGMAAYNAGKFAEAKRAFDEAFKLERAPSFGVWSARARVKLNEWIEAEERYEALLNAPVKSGEDSATEGRAREQAAKEREELRQRMPRLRFRIDGLGEEKADVTVDGVLVAREYLDAKKDGPFRRGKAFQVNPGDHQVVATSGEQRREVSVTVAEGETRDVRIEFINPSTLRQKKCRDQCRAECKTDNSCYVDCKRKCFTEKR